MTRLHERMRRRVCRWVFVVICLLPTSVVLGWSVVRHLPGQIRAEVESLRELTGLRATLGRLVHPLPGTLLYEELELTDPETGAIIFRARAVEVTQYANKLVVRLSQAELSNSGTTDAWQLLERHFRQSTGQPQTQIYFSAHELTWHGPSGSQTFSDVSGRLGPTTQGVEADLKFRLVGQELVDLASLRIERRLSIPAGATVTQPSTYVQFNTGGGRFPARVLAPLWSAEHWLGAEAQFDGYVSFEERQGLWSGDVQGHLVEIDLDSLVSQHFPHTLSGRADLTIRKAVIVDGRLLEADGSIKCGAGMIGQSLLQAGAEHLGLRRPTQLPINTTTTTFGQFACTFVLSRRGLQLFGECAGTPGAMLVADSGVLWEQPSYDPRPVVNLIRALVPLSEVQVPASHESQWLIDVLPVPQIVPPPNVRQLQPPHLKLKPSTPSAS